MTRSICSSLRTWRREPPWRSRAHALTSRRLRANRLKDEFLATLSHELRTPLNAILGYARMLKSGMVNPGRLPRAVEIIHKNSVSLTKIVEDVLDVSRIVSGKLRLKTQTLDLAPVVAACVETVQPAAEAKGIALHAVVEPRRRR